MYLHSLHKTFPLILNVSVGAKFLTSLHRFCPQNFGVQFCTLIWTQSTAHKKTLCPAKCEYFTHKNSPFCGLRHIYESDSKQPIIPAPVFLGGARAHSSSEQHMVWDAPWRPPPGPARLQAPPACVLLSGIEQVSHPHPSVSITLPGAQKLLVLGFSGCSILYYVLLTYGRPPLITLL